MNKTNINRITVAGVKIEDVDVYAYEERLWVSVNSLAERLGLIPRVERKYVRDDTRHRAKVIQGLGKDGRKRKILAIPYSALGIWLFCLNSKRVKDENMQPKLLDAQKRLNVSLNDLLKSVGEIERENQLQSDSLLELVWMLATREEKGNHA